MEELGSGLLPRHARPRDPRRRRGARRVAERRDAGGRLRPLHARCSNAAVRALQPGREPDLAAPLAAVTEINLHAPALLPGDYCQRRARAAVAVQAARQLRRRRRPASRLQEELVDRFGELPEPARALLDMPPPAASLGRAAGRGARSTPAASAIQLQFVPNPPVDPARIIAAGPEEPRLPARRSRPAGAEARQPPDLRGARRRACAS
ncbi:MAG: hypothetical protein MZW92_43350 [Comamonadaceae bacterium]|nr:hypothetical protein [Comamonadaceae bacterium]